MNIFATQETRQTGLSMPGGCPQAPPPGKTILRSLTYGKVLGWYSRQKFNYYVAKGPAGHCWPWMGERRVQGLRYGIIRFLERIDRPFIPQEERAALLRAQKMGLPAIAPAHRVAWSLFNPTEAMPCAVCHSCDHPTCCNPRHLWSGNQSMNAKDMWEKGRARPGFHKGHLHNHLVIG
jgi:hypothetical protein